MVYISLATSTLFPGSHQLDLRVIDKIGNYAQAHFRAVETCGMAARGRKPSTPLEGT